MDYPGYQQNNRRRDDNDGRKYKSRVSENNFRQYRKEQDDDEDQNGDSSRYDGGEGRRQKGEQKAEEKDEDRYRNNYRRQRQIRDNDDDYQALLDSQRRRGRQKRNVNYREGTEETSRPELHMTSVYAVNLNYADKGDEEESLQREVNEFDTFLVPPETTMYSSGTSSGGTSGGGTSATATTSTSFQPTSGFARHSRPIFPADNFHVNPNPRGLPIAPTFTKYNHPATKYGATRAQNMDNISNVLEKVETSPDISTLDPLKKDELLVQMGLLQPERRKSQQELRVIKELEHSLMYMKRQFRRTWYIMASVLLIAIFVIMARIKHSSSTTLVVITDVPTTSPSPTSTPFPSIRTTTASPPNQQQIDEDEFFPPEKPHELPKPPVSDSIAPTEAPIANKKDFSNSPFPSEVLSNLPTIVPTTSSSSSSIVKTSSSSKAIMSNNENSHNTDTDNYDKGVVEYYILSTNEGTSSSLSTCPNDSQITSYEECQIAAEAVGISIDDGIAGYWTSYPCGCFQYFNVSPLKSGGGGSGSSSSSTNNDSTSRQYRWNVAPTTHCTNTNEVQLICRKEHHQR